ncbi:hypothetical protein Pmani_011341 [Petrolisthes manimaculis]|uniref:Uncharacterized protein n=1 Tax=Petrolisthes manimaculis TaxID=1843537 RepID=A0AAE1UBM2_9EUCA|nr:hypothetical protein Pmani_011341 [Petrolisthes manimaculis]
MHLPCNYHPLATGVLLPHAFLPDKHKETNKTVATQHHPRCRPTSNSDPPSNTPTHHQHHLHTPPTTSYNTAANLATAPLPSAQQHVSKPAQTPYHTARTLLWVEDLESRYNFLIDSGSEVIVVTPMTKDRKCQASRA